MCESSWLSSASVNGNPDINDVADVAEKLVEVGIRHLEGKVSNEEGLGRRANLVFTLRLCHVVDNETATLHYGLVASFNSSSGFGNFSELDIAESIVQDLVVLQIEGRLYAYPLLNPLASCAMVADLMLPYGSNSFCRSWAVTSNSKFPT